MIEPALTRPLVTSALAAVDPAPKVVVVGVRPATGPGEPVRVDPVDVARLDTWGVDLPRRLVRAAATGARGEMVWIDLEQEAPHAVLALGMGAATAADLRRSAAVAARRLRGVGEVLVCATGDLDDAGLGAFVEGLLLATPPPSWATSPAPAPAQVARLVVADPVAAGPVVERAAGHARATLAARALIHTPPNLKSPAWLAERAVAAADAAGLDVAVWAPEELARDGFGGLLAVGAGSSRGPRLVRLERRPAGPGGDATDRPGRHVVLVGKGITFDSGGLSLKPHEAQIPMKTDMSGAAVVLAVLGGLGSQVAPQLRVTGLLAVAENLPGAAAMRPGDVVVHHGGLTSEVLNTDAEGRLVLADALDYAVRDLAADVVVDVATLTGAATVGLGRRHAAMFSNDDRLADALAAAGRDAGELVWRMPLHGEYADLITSQVADQANSDRAPGASPGAITAALFLQRFVAGSTWAHLDIAGVGRSDGERDELPKGGTGFGVRLLLRWLEAGAPA